VIFTRIPSRAVPIRVADGCHAPWRRGVPCSVLHRQICRWGHRAAAFSVPLDLRAFLARFDAIAVGFEDFLGNPPDKSLVVLHAVESGFEALLELVEIAHVSLNAVLIMLDRGTARGPSRTRGDRPESQV